MEEKAQKYLNSQCIDYGDLNERAEQQIKKAFIDGMREQLGMQTVDDSGDSPYLESVSLSVDKKYNSNFGDNRKCKCGHVYYRHFDSYEQMEAIGCKYCHCDEFEEDK